MFGGVRLTLVGGAACIAYVWRGKCCKQVS